MPLVAHAPVGDLELYYEDYGDPADQAVLLISGLGAQCLSWPEGLCQGLADRALRVIRFDNRDVGLSTKLDHLRFSFADALAGAMRGETVAAPYRLEAMAADAVGLLDAVGVDRAHIVGMSLGGMIAQLVALDHGHRVASLTSIMSSTGSPDVGQPSAEAWDALTWPGATDRDGAVAQAIAQRRIWGSPGLLDEEALADLFGRGWDRDHHPTAAQRQFGAVMVASNLEARLAGLDVPTLVIHGDRDVLIDPSGGRRTAEVIPGAELVVLEGMGHDLPSVYWAPIIESIVGLVVGADA